MLASHFPLETLRMAGHKDKQPRGFSRRAFLRKMGGTPLLWTAPRLRPANLPGPSPSGIDFPLADVRLTPHYPAPSPLDDIIRQVTPGGDEYVTEKYAFEIMRSLEEWSEALRSAPPAWPVLERSLDASIHSTALAPSQELPIRARYGLEVFCRRFAGPGVTGRQECLAQLKNYFAGLTRIRTAEFQIVTLEVLSEAPLRLRIEIRYEFVATGAAGGREQRVGLWKTEWSGGQAGAWRMLRWDAEEETLSRARSAVFADVTEQAIGKTKSYASQIRPGIDHWRTVLDGATGIDVYGNNGVAAGDFDNDGWDDIYVCQPAGLPNRLYRNLGDGTFEDVTEQAGVGVLDGTACALFADFENKGLQDLLVVCGAGPLLFLNQGNGKFVVKRDAFQFVKPPQGTFTHAAAADYDRDGRLDIYFCLYSYYLGLDQYHYPVPYFDARNGPANFLFHNEGNGTFRDRTGDAGLDAENDRYSFACAWGDHVGSGWPSLFVANDFGRSNLYHNNGDGTFTAVSAEAGVAGVGAGMSASWFDFDGNGRQDVYVADMWSAAGRRVSAQATFHANEPEEIRSLYRRHAGGNTLYRNLGGGKFESAGQQAGVEMGRWAWGSDTWDFDHDGCADLYVANGYVSGEDARDLSSFFWRQVVAKSPQSGNAAVEYERGWNAINELIRSDVSWSGRERNVFYVSHGDGTFSDVSGAVGLDFPEDSRCFALTDLDHDGRLEVILKNRNSPQLRIVRNCMPQIGGSISFRLRGKKSNRDAIGAAVTVEAGGKSQTRYLEAGSGFLSQHGKDLFFGVGDAKAPVRATVRWPGGLTQVFEEVPMNSRIEIEEESRQFVATPYASPQWPQQQESPAQLTETLRSSAETWLIAPLSMPEFSLTDLKGEVRELGSLRGSPALLCFWSAASQASREQLLRLREQHSRREARKLAVLAIHADSDIEEQAVRAWANRDPLPFPILLATDQVAGVYNILYRYLFDRRRDMGLPTTFLLDPEGMLVKIYQGVVNPEGMVRDAGAIPQSAAERIARAIPFPGTLYFGEFQRNEFSYGVALFQRGYLEHAESSFKQVITKKPDNPEAYYNLGTLYLRKNALPEAQRYLERTVQLRPNYPEAWNNLGMIAAQGGRIEEAIRNFQESLRLRPDYSTALLNLGNLYRRKGSLDDATRLLTRALELNPDADANYGLGMVYAQQNQIPLALQFLEKAVTLQPDHHDALNNLGVLLVREQRYREAEEKFKTCIRLAPQFDQAYLNLARLYAMQQQKAKAREVLAALLQRQPQHPMARQALEMLH